LLLPAFGFFHALLCHHLRLSLLRHAALLAVSEWRCPMRARGNREHFVPITTARRKNQLFRSSNGANCARGERLGRGYGHYNVQSIPANSVCLIRRAVPRDSSEMPMKQGLLRCSSTLR